MENTTVAAKNSARYCTTGDGVAMGGYDPVSYFPEGGGTPLKGFVLRSTQHDGVTYRFANDKNLNAFKADPAKYLPAFGGWCAWAVGKLDKKVDSDPENFTIEDGKVHLFYKQEELDALKDWKAHHKDLAEAAQSNWSKKDEKK
jgi:hypothetical protein